MYTLHQYLSTEIKCKVNIFLFKEIDDPNGTISNGCQAFTPCITYGNKVTCRYDESIECVNVCEEESGFCRGGTCYSTEIYNGKRVCGYVSIDFQSYYTYT